MKTNKKSTGIYRLLFAVVVFLCMGLYGYLKDKEVFKVPPMECGIVIKKEFTDQQYIGQYSMGIVKIVKSGFVLGFKSFKLADYVEEGDELCKETTVRIKQDKFLKQPQFLFPFTERG